MEIKKITAKKQKYNSKRKFDYKTSLFFKIYNKQNNEEVFNALSAYLCSKTFVVFW